MPKLYIQPQPRQMKLGMIINALRNKGYVVEIIGYGYPPIYVETDRGQWEQVKEIVKTIDSTAIFSSYRVDAMTTEEIIKILKGFTPAEIIELCLTLDIDPDWLPGYAKGDLQLATISLIHQLKKKDDLKRLIEAAYKINPGLF